MPETPAPPAAAPQSLGRFVLQRLLGERPGMAVWQAFDPQHKGPVTLRLPAPDNFADANALARWLARARGLQGLRHPRILPVLEADVHGTQPYLVSAYLPGRTLQALLASQGALPPAEAIAVLRDLLEALAVLHAAGLVHPALQSSNVLVDEGGRAFLMDIAPAPVPTAGAAEAATAIPQATPAACLSPEVAQGQRQTPAADLFAAGLLMVEMLRGAPLLDAGRDPEQARYRLVHEQLMVPPDIGEGVDDSLRAIVQRALARDPALRHAGALDMREALARWSGVPSDDALSEDGEDAPDSGSGALQQLLRRMRRKSDFPAMSDAVLRIQTLTSSETESIGSITNEILKDVGLTNKLLRLVNSAHYARAGGSIRTVSRAVSLVGLHGIRNLALSLVLLERMQDKTHAALLKEEFLRCLMAGVVGGELCPLAHESEEAFIASMFQNLGRLLTGFYFPEEARTIRGLLAAARQPLSEEAAAASVLGLDFEALGAGVARAWGLPESIQHCIHKPLGAVPMQPPAQPGERLRWLAFTANEVADLLVRSEPREFEARLDPLATRHAKALGIKALDVKAAVRAARLKLIDMAAALQLHLAPGAPAARLLLPPSEAQSDASGPRGGDTLAALELQAIDTLAGALAAEPAADDGTRRAEHVAQTLMAGIQDITHAMVEDYKLNDVLRMALETMLRALDFRYIVFCMRDPRTDTLTGRFGLGEGVERIVRAFQVPLKAGSHDLMAAVCTRGLDTMISDAAEPRIAERLPSWYHQHIQAPAFLLLPLQIQGRPFGLIYADMAHKSGLQLDERELALLRTLRNQAVMAFKRTG